MHAVVTKGLAKRYGEIEALGGIDLHIDQGEVFGILGPNGAGKTTLIQILCTMLRPTAGEAWVGGHSVLQNPDDVRRQLGVVFQNATVDLVMSARENLWIHGRLYGMPARALRARIPELLDLAGLSDRAEEPLRRFSGGMRRRLELVRSILHGPRILLLDEPTVGLDPQSRRLIWDHVARLKKELGMTILLTTHYLEEADALCDRVAIIDHGRIDVLDSPRELKRSIGGDALSVQLKVPASRAAALVRDLPNVESVHTAGDRLLVRLRDSSATIPRLVERLSENGIHVATLDHRPASLDDVFLRRTGRAPRERAPASTPRPSWWRRVWEGLQ